MKIITINCRKAMRFSGFMMRMLAFLIITALCVQLSCIAIERSDLYVETVSSISEKRTIVIDAGHGGEDCGAIGVNGVYEKDLNLAISTIVGEMLTEQGYAIVYTRTADRLLYTEEENVKGIRKISDLKNRCKIAAEYDESLLVSIHMNSYGSAKYSGLHVYYSPNNPESERLAQTIQNRVRSDIQPNNNRVPKPGKNMYILENVDNTAVLVECGFLTNTEECEKLSEKEYQKELSFSIVCGIIEYIEKQDK